MEEEVRVILRDAVKQERAPAGGGLGSRIAARFTGLGLKAPLPELEGEPARAAELDS